MKPFVAAGLALVLGWGPTGAPADDASAILAAATTCHGAGTSAITLSPSVAPGLVPGFGDAGFVAEGATESAAGYFEQGARLTHAFNAPEAIRAFAWAEHVDSGCALCAWGEAWARGPTINYPIDAAEDGRARAAAGRAARLATTQPLSPSSQGLIAAIAARYPAGQARVDNVAYADAMEALTRRFPQDDAIAVETASALLIASGQAWADLAHGPANARVRRARALLEAVLVRSPRFTPAIHFYIHLMEWQGEPQKAVAYADTLGALAPAAGHLVHMPSHLYYRLGRYEDAATSNARAAAADAAYVRALHPPGGLPGFALHAHNLSFGLAGAMMSGDGAAALAFARDMRETFPGPDGPAGRAWFADARYAPVADVLSRTPPPANTPAFLWRYARGEAQARAGRADAVEVEAKAIGDLRAKAPGDDLAEIARLTLDGRAALLSGHPDRAIPAFRRAATLRDRLDETPDPPSWYYPPRRSLGAALLLAGDARGAERELGASLKTEPGDGLALFALSQAQVRLHDPAASATLSAARRAWRGDPAAFRLELM